MGRIINLHIEQLPEGVFLATSEDVQGLLAQGATIEETIDIARDVARVLIEMDAEQATAKPFPVSSICLSISLPNGPACRVSLP